ncbi:hypothetical protein COV56_02790 [Candidatus Kuenenbacteria bacterium CG11_big_fil_rev_8_21_14_0_20_37_9]|uniref:Uncharacterized protein n=2 Tax=Candidatus Kueneniibacteriota TaxID=1752740 RepID=A0A2M6XTC7_9BACT|nr:MAG: hypothetical protein AUJ29_00060 [Candidatus Kuenenbacteria bacterium CG1_02_38_13]PIR05438.1 MAG: hypothetical protein COV56_02790 [Candidatus Kuenenbacteria bacterium CG11_big_fil_rev_8_21_14_0_20_37_9]PIU10831.1 MAG: hypothetical protein COT27_01190 [Candidatus Kuenenbacteria bacterium CG08_land_8_20_14_0_20_37_23]
MNAIAKKMITIILFFILGLAADNIKVASILGVPGQTFTILQLFAPAFGAFLGGLIGFTAVFVTEAASFILQSKEVTLINLLRFLPLLLATLYFVAITRPAVHWFKKIVEIIIPISAMLFFWLHPTGRAAWPYALFWFVPVVVSISPLRKFLFAQALGSTFTAHAAGSLIFLYLTSMPAAMWLSLIPLVARERLVFSLGITLTYLIFNTLLLALPRMKFLSLNLNPRYQFFPSARKIHNF